MFCILKNRGAGPEGAMVEQTNDAPAPDTRSAPEYRASVRFPGNNIEVESLSHSRAADLQALTRVRDISSGGIGLIVDRLVKSEMLLGVRLVTNKGLLLCRYVRVIHVRAQREGEWVIGGEFVHPLSPEELDSLAGQFSGPPT
jgi:hypothetical protein